MQNNEAPVTPETWTDHKGRTVVIATMSDRWLNNIRKKFKGQAFIKPVTDEIQRRKQKRQIK